MTTTKKTNQKKTTPRKTAKKTTVKKNVQTSVKKPVVVEAVKSISTPVAQTPIPEKKCSNFSSRYPWTRIFLIVLVYAELITIGYLFTVYDISYSYVRGQLCITSTDDYRNYQMNRLRHIARLNEEIKSLKKENESLRRQLRPVKAPRLAKFDPVEYKPYSQKGKTVIRGKACIGEGTDKKCFKNTEVFINPVTTYSTEWYRRGWAGNEILANADSRVIPFNIKTKTDKDGNFEFKNLPEGFYFVGMQVMVPVKGSCPESHRFATIVKTAKKPIRASLQQVWPK